MGQSFLAQKSHTSSPVKQLFIPFQSEEYIIQDAIFPIWLCYHNVFSEERCFQRKNFKRFIATM